MGEEEEEEEEEEAKEGVIVRRKEETEEVAVGREEEVDQCLGIHGKDLALHPLINREGLERAQLLLLRLRRLLPHQGSGFMVQGAGCRVQGAGCRVQGSGFRVQGSGSASAASCPRVVLSDLLGR